MGPVHSLLVGRARVTLDLRSRAGCELDRERDVRRRLSSAESRLVLLDWTRGRMPAPSPRALWAVEAASLACAGSAPHWREWATIDLHRALVSLIDSRIEWPSGVRGLLARSLEAASVAAASVDGQALDSIMSGLGDVVAPPAHDAGSIPAPEEVPGCGEVEWDRVGPAGIDLGELGVRSRILGTTWTASVGPSGIRQSREGARLWARLVDDASGRVLDEVEMHMVERVWAARGYVPPSARGTTTRVDLTALPELAARPQHERRLVLEEQAWFRLLQFERLSTTGSSWAMWRDAYRERLGVAASDGGQCRSGPFLAESHIRPTDLASGRLPLLSPRPAGDAPCAT